MKTDKIEQLLARFSDQNLANLQAATEDGRLLYSSCDHCLLFHFQGNYSYTKWESADARLARDAEAQYRDLGRLSDGDFQFSYWDEFAKPIEETRRKAILPLIHAEWARRKARPVDIIQQYGVDFEFTTQDR